MKNVNKGLIIILCLFFVGAFVMTVISKQYYDLNLCKIEELEKPYQKELEHSLQLLGTVNRGSDDNFISCVITIPGLIVDSSKTVKVSKLETKAVQSEDYTVQSEVVLDKSEDLPINKLVSGDNFVTVYIGIDGDKNYTLGEEVAVSLNATGTLKPYVVPSEVIRHDGSGDYVYGVLQRERPWGQECYVKKSKVYVAEENGEETAITYSLFTPLVIKSDKELADGLAVNVSKVLNVDNEE